MNNIEKNAWDSLLCKLSYEYIKDKDSKEFFEVLDTTSSIIAHSVLNKCIDPQKNSIVNLVKKFDSYISDTGYNMELVKLKRELTSANYKLKNVEYCVDNAYKTITNKNGDQQIVANDTACIKALDTIVYEPLGNGIDFKHESAVALIDRMEYELKEYGSIDLAKERTEKRLNKKVWYKDFLKELSFKEYKTSGIKEVFAAVRRYVENTASAKIEPNGQLYLESVVDVENESVTTYKKLPLYADIGGFARDFNGACTLYSANEKLSTDMDVLINKLELTAYQRKVLEYRLGGFGYEVIAKKLEVSKGSVYNTIIAIQKKALNKLELDSQIVEKLKGKNDVSRNSKLTDIEREEIKNLAKNHTFAYIASLYGVSKMTVSRIVNGRKDR